MNYLFIIGNGLDISCGLKTSYQDFFEYYLRVKSVDVDIDRMKSDIQHHRYENWSDLEMGLGNYSNNCKDKGIFSKCLNNIKLELSEYLRNEGKKISELKLKSVDPLVSLDKVLDPEPQSRFLSFVNHNDTPDYIDIITFNYTPTLETLLEYKGQEIPIAKRTLLHSIVHVHGTLDDMMVMGVNDESQISNELLRDDIDVKEDFIKPEYNDACENNKNLICESLVKWADVIIIYGSSVGQSDDKWWKLIGGRMEKEDKLLLVYLPHDDKKNQKKEPNRIRRWTQEYITEIKQKFGITIADEILKERVCVAVNKRLLTVERNLRLSTIK